MSKQAQEALLLGLIMNELGPRVKRWVAYTGEHKGASFAELEQEALRLSRGVFVPLLAKALEQRCGDVEVGYCCEGCGGTLANKGRQERSQETLIGRVSWRRSYYYCARCRQGHYPLDESLGMERGEFSEGVQNEVSRAAAKECFVPAAREFTRQTQVSISGRTVERIAEKRGAALAASLHEEEAGVFERGEEVRLEEGSSAGEGCRAVALDATTAHFQDGWHEVKVGVVFRPEVRENGKGQKEVHCIAPSYVVDVGSMDQLGRKVYVEACKRGVRADQELTICLGDGALTNWKQFATHFPQRVEILDWYHAMEHVWAAAHDAYGEGSPQAQSWADAQENLLWNGRTAELLIALQTMAQLYPTIQAQVHYFRSNQTRMRYDQYRASGYPIGSGPVESACKRLVGRRLKPTGMRWSPEGAQAILHLRAALLSERWDEAWARTRSSPKLA
jgi:hypothetical protein